MPPKKQVYKNPLQGEPLITTICAGCKTPLLEVKFSNLVNPFYYPNSPKIPRYSITAVIDPVLHEDFVTGINAIVDNEKTDSAIKIESIKEEKTYIKTGKFILKFQTREVIPVFIKKGNDLPAALELEDELAPGEKIIIFYDVLRYLKRNAPNCEHGLNFKPTKIYFCPQEGN